MKLSFIFGLILGLVIMSCFVEWNEKKIPEAISIERNGKVIGYADTNSGTMEFANLKDAKSPGVFLAFPLFMSKGEKL